MFTGIIQATGRVARLTSTDTGVRLVVDPGDWSYTPSLGDSVAVSGVCLTYAPHADDAPGCLGFDVIHETLAKTKLGTLAEGDRVNLESCLTPTTPMGGHFVQGHVDTTASVQAIESADGEYRVVVHADAAMMRYIIPKGSIAIDGVSLTIADVDVASHRFAVALIPTTLELTTFSDLKVGDAVNLEADMLVKAVVHNLELVRRQVTGDSQT
ncbi:MAG: riboflavin synthase [Phycisphaera sp.]|nr:riboflavin synthase [Phycisphaera sp.]